MNIFTAQNSINHLPTPTHTVGMYTHIQNYMEWNAHAIPKSLNQFGATFLPNLNKCTFCNVSAHSRIGPTHHQIKPFKELDRNYTSIHYTLPYTLLST